MRVGALGAVALLVLASCLHVCRAQAANSTTKTLYQYLTALEQNKTFYYEPVDRAYYASINNNSIIEFNGTFYEDLNGTFYALQRQANGTFILPANESGIAEGLTADGKRSCNSLQDRTLSADTSSTELNTCMFSTSVRSIWSCDA